MTNLPGIALRFYFDDVDPSIRCECGWHCHGDSANDAWEAWYKHQANKHAEVLG